MAFAPSVAKDAQAFAFSKRDAKRTALATCQANAFQDCQGAVWVRNGWMAIAYEETAGAPPRDTLGWGSGWGPTDEVALSHAYRICQQNVGKACTSHSALQTPAFDPAAPTRGGAW